jgi:antitoxin VapB
MLCKQGEMHMQKTHIAKLFKNGASQAVRLPAEFRFEGDQVFISRDEKTQNVILSEKPGSQVWEEFFEFMKTVDIPDDWMKDRPMNRISTRDRTLFREDD